MFRSPRKPINENGTSYSMTAEDFRKRQAADLARYADADGEYVVRRRPFHERLEHTSRETSEKNRNGADVAVESDPDASSEEDMAPTEERGVNNHDGEESWRNKEGERLADFGVDEVAEFYDEDDVPLAELIRRHKAEHR